MCFPPALHYIPGFCKLTWTQFHLTTQAKEAFSHLCLLFTSAPLLPYPDVGMSFVGEVDTSSVGIGVVLSHPCSFVSWKINPTQQWWVLAIKWALEEWHHWLQGSAEPFMVLTDHQNLLTIQQTKQLNPRQAVQFPSVILSRTVRQLVFTLAHITHVWTYVLTILAICIASPRISSWTEGPSS